MINRFKWLELKPETRQNIVIYLNTIEGFPKVVKTGTVEVAGNKVVCDGMTDQDLCKITPELLRAALDERTLRDLKVDTNDVYAMFYELVRRIEMPPVEIKSTPLEESPESVKESIDNAKKINKK